MSIDTFSALAEPFNIGGLRIRNRIFQAPMSGITDEPMRERAFRHGAGLVVAEMVASGELVKGREEARRRLSRPNVPVHMVQLAGRDAGLLAEAARVVEGEGADILDINMGCPAKKVTGGYAGSALMRDLDHAVTLIAAVVAAVRIPVTVKMRLGWDDDQLNAPLLAARAERSGVAMITVHGRTRCQFYQGQADWAAIRAVREAVMIPLVVNGDIKDEATASEALKQSGADAIMLGRAHYGAPWVAGSLAALAAGATSPVPAGEDLGEYIVDHYGAILSLYGIESGLRQARKHLGWYLDRHRPSADSTLRKTIMTGTDPAGVIEAVRQAFDTEPYVSRIAA